MGVRIAVDLAGLTFGDLYGFVDQARWAGLQEGEYVTVEHGEGLSPQGLSADLGDSDGEPIPWVVLEREDVDRYVVALTRTLDGQSEAQDSDMLSQLLEALSNQ